MDILFVFFGFGIAYFLVLKLVMPKDEVLGSDLLQISGLNKRQITTLKDLDEDSNDLINNSLVCNVYHEN